MVIEKYNHAKVILPLAVSQFVLLVAVTVVGAFTKDFYFRETFNWTTQAVAQDLVDLFIIAPILIVSAIMADRNNLTSLLIWGGTNLFLIYTFAIYCFAVHFNFLFLPYCIEFGLSVYSFIYFAYIIISSTNKISAGNKYPFKSASIFSMFVAIIFYLLWLSEIFPALINNTTPKTIVETGTLTNPVHVIDIAVCLPALFISGLLLRKKNRIGVILAPILLVFCAEMSASICALMIIMKIHGMAAELAPFYFMSIIVLVSIVFLIKIFGNLVIDETKTV